MYKLEQMFNAAYDRRRKAFRIYQIPTPAP